jgi:hypothetical protein
MTEPRSVPSAAEPPSAAAPAEPGSVQRAARGAPASRVPGWDTPTPSPSTVDHALGLTPPSRVAHLRIGLLTSCVVAVPAIGIGAAVAGVAGALGALGGVLAIAASFVISTLAVAAADARDPALVLPVGLFTYIVKVVVVGVIAFGVSHGHAQWHAVTGWTVVATTISWAVAQAWWFWHTPRPYVVLAEPERSMKTQRAKNL